MVALCSTLQRLPLIVLFWKNRLWVDCKIESRIVSILTLEGQEGKENFIDSSEEMGASTADSS